MHVPSNLVLLRGEVSSEPTRRDLPGGRSVVQFDLRTSTGEPTIGGGRTVPLAWYDPTERELATAPCDSEVVVVGEVNRRFFRVGGQTQSRTEVVVVRLVPSRRTKTVDAVVGAVVERLTRGCVPPDRSAASA